MPKLTLATWNINSVRLRIDLVKKLLKNEQPDILCLQEIKCLPDQFPRKIFERAGYPYIAVHGQKGYHGVATVSRVPFREIGPQQFCGKDDARCVRIAVDDAFELHNFYVPSGGDVPDPDANEKFAHKLQFLDEMGKFFRKRKKSDRIVLVGDLNVAPLEHDVWSHKQMLKVVSHTPVEVTHMETLQKSLNWRDVTRLERPEPEKVYTWWSYRARDWAASDRGRRLDHIWVTPGLEPHANNVRILRDARGWKSPSDHVPVMMDLTMPG